MNAWLITWEWNGEHVKMDKQLIAILGSRLSSKYIRKYIEHYYLSKTSSPGEMAEFANRPRKLPFKAEPTIHIPMVHDYMWHCGDNPFIYARKVADLEIHDNQSAGFTIVTWKEPGYYQGDSLDSSSWVRHDGEFKTLSWSYE